MGAVEDVKSGADDGGEESHGEEGEDCPEAAATAEVPVGALAAVVVGLGTVELAVWVVKLRFCCSGVAIGCGGCGGCAVNCTVSVGFGRWVSHFGYI